MPGRTIADILIQKFRKKFVKTQELGERATLNPLGVRVGGILTIDSAEENGLYFSVREIAHAVETIGPTQVPFTDYILIATPGGDDRADGNGKVRRVLRVLPVEEGDAYLQFQMILLSLFYECDYQQASNDNLNNLDFQAGGDRPWPVLQDPAGEFRDFETGELFVRRFRGYAGWEKPHVAQYTVLRDEDGDGRVDEAEVEEGRVMQFWDYQRELMVGSKGRSRTEYLYVEEDQDGYFRLYKGRQVSQETIIRL